MVCESEFHSLSGEIYAQNGNRKLKGRKSRTWSLPSIYYDVVKETKGLFFPSQSQAEAKPPSKVEYLSSNDLGIPARVGGFH